MTPKRLPLVALAVVALTGFPGCNKEKSVSTTHAQKGSDELPPDQVVATFEGGKITAGELEKQVGRQLRQLDMEHRKKKFDLRREALERAVLTKLIEDAARKQNMLLPDGGPDADQWVTKEIEGGIPPPTDEELQAIYNQLSQGGQIPPGVTFEQIKDRLIPFAGREQKQARAMSVFENLKKQANVKFLLEEPRVQVEAKGASRGPESAKVTIVEFSDFECPFCSRAKATVDKVMEGYAGKVRLVFRHYPLPMHQNAPKASEAALCAHDQGKFWEMHDKLFENQRALAVEQLREYAKAIGLDEAKFNACLDSGEKAKIVEEDMAAGEAAGVSSTPSFFINGRSVQGAQPEEEFRRIIDEELQGG